MDNKELFKSTLLATKCEGIDKLLNYLEKTDFYTAPASTKFHSSYEGGLLQHSINVYNCLLEKTKTGVWSKYKYNEETIAIVSLLHDLCKVDFYTVSTRNVKNEETGKWEKQPFYQIDDQLPYGHGEKSVYIISSFIKLSREEAMAIRWHMGFSESKENYNAVNKAFSMYPLCLALSESDMEASALLEVDD